MTKSISMRRDLFVTTQQHYLRIPSRSYFAYPDTHAVSRAHLGADRMRTHLYPSPFAARRSVASRRRRATAPSPRTQRTRTILRRQRVGRTGGSGDGERIDVPRARPRRSKRTTTFHLSNWCHQLERPTLAASASSCQRASAQPRAPRSPYRTGRYRERIRLSLGPQSLASVA